MFKSYSSKYLNYNPKTNLCNYEVTVEDDKFGSETVSVGVSQRVTLSAIIQIYSRRNLNVAKNLFLFMRYIEKKNFWAISQQIEYYKKYIPEYNKYHQEVQKFLLFT